MKSLQGQGQAGQAGLGGKASEQPSLPASKPLPVSNPRLIFDGGWELGLRSPLTSVDLQDATAIPFSREPLLPPTMIYEG